MSKTEAVLERMHSCGTCRMQLPARWRAGREGEEAVVMDVVASALAVHRMKCPGIVSARPAVRVEHSFSREE